jgi:hypothetical protein
MNRVYHTWDKWECYPAGFYEEHPPKKEWSEDDCRRIYADFLRDHRRFEAALQRVISEWKNSCEHYLTNDRMNRIAWLGQASVCIESGIASKYRGGFNQLSEEEQAAANELALKYLNLWLGSQGEPAASMEEAMGRTEVELY